MNDFRDPRTYRIIGAAMAVHREYGPGFLESAYHGALAIEFQLQGIPFRHEVELPMWYRGHKIGAPYRADFVCFDDIIVELKALKAIGEPELNQLIHYILATNKPLGLLLNFGGPSLEFRRAVGPRFVPSRWEDDTAPSSGRGESVQLPPASG